jgi:ABC-type multidrug transport system ATPase subunit
MRDAGNTGAGKIRAVCNDTGNTGNIIDVHDLHKSFGAVKVVDGLSLQVGKGEICGFLGANGSGKTTTIRMLCGLLSADAGYGACLGLDIIRQAPMIRRRVGYMTQKFSFYDDLTVFENLDLVANVYEMPERQQRGCQYHGPHGKIFRRAARCSTISTCGGPNRMVA